MIYVTNRNQKLWWWGWSGYLLVSLKMMTSTFGSTLNAQGAAAAADDCVNMESTSPECRVCCISTWHATFFSPLLWPSIYLSLNDADFNILAFTFVINAMPSRASQSITPNPPTVLFDCCGLMDVQSITIRTVPLSTAKEPYWHCHHSSIGILLLFSSERRTQHLSDWLKPNFSIYLFLFIYVKFRSSSHFGFGDVQTNVSIGRNCQIGLPHPRDADAHRRVVQGQYLLCTTFHFGVFFFRG